MFALYFIICSLQCMSVHYIWCIAFEIMRLYECRLLYNNRILILYIYRYIQTHTITWYTIYLNLYLCVSISISTSTSLSISIYIYIQYSYYPYLWPTEYVYTLPILPTSRHLSSCHPKVQALASASGERRCCKRVYWCLRNGWELMEMDHSLITID